MKHLFFSLAFWGVLLLLPCRAGAQNPPPPVPRTETPYLLPQTIFVGDPGRLVVPLGQDYAGAAPFVLEAPEKLSQLPDMVIRRIELEHRGGGARLLIDFISYAPGLLSFPPLDLPAPDLPEDALPAITGLEVSVASILSPSQMTLSESASSLAVPGTSLLIYGTLALILFLLFLGIGGSLWGRRHFRGIWERLRRRHLLRVMMRFLLRLRQECNLDNNGKGGRSGRPQKAPGFYLTLLSGEFREFLSLFTGVNCRPLSAGEFMYLSLEYGREASEEDRALLSPAFLCRLFRTWDTLRFSGRLMDRVDLFLALQETENFLIALEKAEREQLLFRTPVVIPAQRQITEGEA